MNRLPLNKKVAVISALVEGCSVRSALRMTGVAKGTILRLLAEVGTACSEYQERALRNIPTKRIQIDEIWSFVGCKERTSHWKSFNGMGLSAMSGRLWQLTQIRSLFLVG